MNQNTQQTDEQLAIVSLKDKNKFAELVQRYEQKLSRYIRRLTNLNTQCIEDVLQETFIKIYKNLNNFDPTLSFSSWAYRISHNEALNYIHKNKNKNTAPIETDDKDTASLIDILESDTNVEAEVAQKEIAEKIRVVIKKLPKKYRDVIILYYLEQKDYSEISDILKKPMGTIATLLNRAKSKFKTLALKHNIVT
ncbi:RNA polymerase sigma factor [Patescibacteria group bacterium]